MGESRASQVPDTDILVGFLIIGRLNIDLRQRFGELTNP